MVIGVCVPADRMEQEKGAVRPPSPSVLAEDADWRERPSASTRTTDRAGRVQTPQVAGEARVDAAEISGVNLSLIHI